VRRKVLDQTGLTGVFSFHVDFNVHPPGGTRATSDPAASDPVAAVATTLRKFA
jgi:hypothetical protein